MLNLTYDLRPQDLKFNNILTHLLSIYSENLKKIHALILELSPFLLKWVLGLNDLWPLILWSSNLITSLFLYYSHILKFLWKSVHFILSYHECTDCSKWPFNSYDLRTWSHDPKFNHFVFLPVSSYPANFMKNPVIGFLEISY